MQKFETTADSNELRKPMKSSVLDKYAKPETSDIMIEVPSPSGVYDFDIPNK